MDVKTENESPGDKKMAPAIANAYLNRGLIQSDRGKTDAAISDFTKALRIEDSNFRALANRALEYEKKGDLKAALADINRAIEMEPKNGYIRVELGVIHLLMGKEKEAEAVFDMLLSANRTLWQKRIAERLVQVGKAMPSEK